MDYDMYKDAPPDNVAWIVNDAYRFATEGDRMDKENYMKRMQ